MNIRAFVTGYRQGREGLPPLATVGMTEQELADLESEKPPESAHEWAWHLIGWTVGQAVALHEMAR